MPSAESRAPDGMTNTLEIRAPADQTEGTRSQILRWLKTVGDSVTEHEPLIEIETDKVTVEVASPAAGILREIVKGEQEEVAPGDVLGRIEAAPSESTHALQTDDALHAGAQALTDPPRNTPGNRQPQPLSPAVRRLLSERGLDASVIQGTGENGRITIDDVLAHTASNAAPAVQSNAPTADATPSASAPQASPSGPSRHASGAAQTAPPSRTIPHTAIRKRIATHMVQSLLQTAPHVTTVFEADLTAIQTHRATNRTAFEAKGAPLTLTAYFIAATVNAIRAVPEANSRWTDTALELYDDIHIGVATAIEGSGLVVPVLKHAESLDLFGIAEALNRLVIAAREGNLDPTDVRGGTFTISNHGVSGSLLATPIIINQPQSAILGIGKLEKRPVVLDKDGTEQILIRPKCYVTLTIDHRVMDGHQANHFLQVFVRTLESWPAT